MMDPKACLDLAACFLSNEPCSSSYQDAAEALANYAQWRFNGGYEPAGGDAKYKHLLIDLGMQADVMVEEQS
jgi:hypothetical protein